MNKTATTIAAFVLGTILGSGATYIFMKKEIDKVNDDKETEIASARQVYVSMAKDLQNEKKRIMEENEERKARYKDDINEYLNDIGHISQTLIPPEEDEKFPEFAVPKKEEDPRKDIYLITQEDYGWKVHENGDEEQYNLETYVYYHDGVVTDQMGDIVEDPTEILGKTVMDLLPTYDESGFSETYVRNDNLKTDYMIDIAGCDFDE